MMLCKFRRPLPKQFVSTISAASFVPSTRLHASLILSNVKPSRRDEGPTYYGMNNVSNAGIKTGFDLIIAKGLSLSAKFTNDDFDRRPEKRKSQSRCVLRKSAPRVHIKIFGPHIKFAWLCETFWKRPLDSLSVRSWLTEYSIMLWPRPLPEQFVSTISDANFVACKRLHASLILRRVNLSRRDEGPTCYGTNNISNTEMKLVSTFCNTLTD